MRYFLNFILALLVFPGIALGGQVYGKLKEAGRSVPAGIDVIVGCGNATPHPTKTDRYGSYRVHVRETGRCTLTVTRDGRSGKDTIRSSKDPVRYNFELVRKGKTYLLKRK